MRFVLDGFVVEVRAKLAHEERFTKDKTMDFMNSLSIICHDAARYYRQENSVFADRTEEMGTEIYEKLLKAGAYR